MRSNASLCVLVDANDFFWRVLTQKKNFLIEHKWKIFDFAQNDRAIAMKSTICSQPAIIISLIVARRKEKNEQQLHQIDKATLNSLFVLKSNVTLIGDFNPFSVFIVYLYAHAHHEETLCSTSFFIQIDKLLFLPPSFESIFQRLLNRL